MTEADRRFRKNLVAGAMFVGPLLILIGIAISSGVYTGDNEATYLASIREHADAFWIGNVISASGAMLMPLIILGLVHLIRVRKRVYGTVTGVIACMGAFGIGAAWLVGSLAEYQMAHQPNQAAMVALSKSMESDAVIPLAFIWISFMLGMVLIAVGLFLSRSVPRWSAVLFALATVGFFFSEGGASEIVVNVLLVTAFSSIAWSIWKRTPDQWESGELPASEAASAAPAEPAPAAA